MNQCQWTVPQRAAYVERCVVTADQMQAIESRSFDAGMPVAALMDKVGGLIAQRVMQHYPLERFRRVGVLVGPGHNGGDALVVARELHAHGYTVARCQPFQKLKELTAAHSRYADHLGIPASDDGGALRGCDLVIDGLFGFGLTRPLDGAIAHLVNQVNDWPAPIVSIDLPSGLDTDTGTVLGCAIDASRTLCLGLWKRSLLQDAALEVAGQVELIDFGLPVSDIQAVLGPDPSCQRITTAAALAPLALPRRPDTHKYREGHLLLVCGSRRYMGAAILTGLAARASGVGMLSIAVPDELKASLVNRLPDALIIGCPTHPGPESGGSGAIAHFPDSVNLDDYDAIACGPGLTLQAKPLVQQLCAWDGPLLLDADGLNGLTQLDPVPTLNARTQPTVLTPHPGEFKRLFPDLADELKGDRITAAQKAAQISQATVVLKGACTVVAQSDGTLWVNPSSTAALARGGSGDVLTGLMGGLMAQAIAHDHDPEAVVKSAVWWHAQGAIAAAQEKTELGVDASTLVDYLSPTLQQHLASNKTSNKT